MHSVSLSETNYNFPLLYLRNPNALRFIIRQDVDTSRNQSRNNSQINNLLPEDTDTEMFEAINRWIANFCCIYKTYKAYSDRGTKDIVFLFMKIKVTGSR